MTDVAVSCWLTAAEIAERDLPGLPTNKRAVNDFARRHGWATQRLPDGKPLARPRAGRGGGIEYHSSQLPIEAQECLTLAPPVANDTGDEDAKLWAWYEAQTDAQKSRALARQKILLEIERLVECGTGRTAAVKQVAAKNGCSRSTVMEWRTLVATAPKSQWLPRLVPDYKGGGKEVEVDPEVWQLILSDYLRPERPAFAACYNRALEDYCAPRGLALPPMDTLRRRAEKEISARERIKKRDGKEALRKTIPPLLRSVTDLHALEAVNIDGHKLDFFVLTEDDRVVRLILIGIQDVYSRKILAWRIGETENTQLARLVFADLFRNWGLPTHAILDNGRGFAAKDLTGGAKTRFRGVIQEYEQTGVLTALNVQTCWTLPYRGSSKPIERAWRDLHEYIAKHPDVSGAYTGNKPDAKPENYRERAIPIAQAIEHIGRCIERHNARPGRKTEMAGGVRSFNEVFQASYEASVIRRATETELRIALLEAATRKCHRQHGAVTIHGNSYWAPELVDYRGKNLVVRFDPDNLHAPQVHIYDLKGRYLFPAGLREATGFLTQASAKQRAKDEARLRKQERAVEEGRNRLSAAKVAELLSGHSESLPAPRPTPAATRVAGARGHVAQALKPTQQVAEPAEPTFIGDFAAGVQKARLRAVD